MHVAQLSTPQGRIERDRAQIDYLQNGVYQSAGSTIEPDNLQVKDYDRIVRSLRPRRCSEAPF
jgi:hypothetical protein